MLVHILFVTFSFFILYYGAELLVRGATALALNLKVSKVVVGLTLVAFGTSSPELFVNLVAAGTGHTGFALTNVAGSNLANLCIGFGACALVGKLVIEKAKFRPDLLFFSLTPFLIVFFFLVFPGGYKAPFWACAPLLLLFIFYLITVKKRVVTKEESETPKHGLPVGILLFLLGCGMLYGGGRLVLYSSVAIAEHLGISETIIGLTLVAVGTSIPDVMASAVAIRKQETSIAVGNLLGSNIFNILLVLGGTSLISMQDLMADKMILMDYCMVGVTSVIFAILVGITPWFSRTKGVVFILIYVAYMVIRISLWNTSGV
jgi:cation:H+ antiporter